MRWIIDAVIGGALASTLWLCAYTIGYSRGERDTLRSLRR